MTIRDAGSPEALRRGQQGRFAFVDTALDRISENTSVDGVDAPCGYNEIKVWLPFFDNQQAGISGKGPRHDATVGKSLQRLLSAACKRIESKPGISNKERDLAKEILRKLPD